MELVLRSGDRSGEAIAVPAAGVVIGRDLDCDVVLDDGRTSRRHARVRPRAAGGFEVEDLGSGNGTFVNGKRVTGVVAMGHGDELRIGGSVLGARDPSAVAAAAAPTILGTVLGSTASALHRIRVERGVRRAVMLAGAALVVVIGLAGYVVLAGSDDDGDRIAEVVDKVRPGTVVVQSLAGEKVVESGSGFVLDGAAGLIVTNAHVVNGGATFEVGNGEGVGTASVVGVAPCEDLAVLKVTGVPGLRSLPLGRQSSLRQGQTVVAVGYPANASREAELTSTTGIVSIARSAYREASIDVPNYANVVQTDAAINPGSSGGPLVDLSGRLVGVNSAGRTIAPDGRVIQGQSYAIGVDQVRRVVGGLRAGRSSGWLGVGFRWPTRAELADGSARRGIALAGAIRGPLRDGGRVLEVDGTPVGTTLVGWCDAAAGLATGAEVKLKLASGSRRLRLP